MRLVASRVRDRHYFFPSAHSFLSHSLRSHALTLILPHARSSLSPTPSLSFYPAHLCYLSHSPLARTHCIVLSPAHLYLW